MDAKDIWDILQGILEMVPDEWQFAVKIVIGLFIVAIIPLTVLVIMALYKKYIKELLGKKTKPEQKDDEKPIPGPSPVSPVVVVQNVVQPPAEPPAPEAPKPVKPLTDPPPGVKESFQFREQLVESLRRQIAAAEKTEGENKFLLTGFGGVGKTAVARALYHKLKDGCKQIGWVECRESGDLRASLLASFDTGDEKKSDKERFAQIRRQLRAATGETVLFLDNVDKPDPLLDQLTGYDLTLVVTSRMEQVEGYLSRPIPQLSEAQCVELFRTYCSRTIPEQDEPVVRDLVRLVSCHTLSVELLAKGVPWGMGLAAYRDKLKEEGFGFPGLKFGTGHDQAEQTVVEHLKKLFDLAKLDREQTRVMQNLALMAESRTLPFEVREWIGCDENTLDGLARTGWLTRTEEGYEVHPIVREIVLLDPVPVEAVEKFLYFVAYKDYFQNGEDYRAVQLKLGIVEAVLEQVKDRLEEKRDTGAIYAKLGNVYREQGDYIRAESCQKKALDIYRKEYGEDHQSTAMSYNNLGNVYDNQGKYDQAEKCHRKALDIFRRRLGEDHPDTAGSYNNLGNVYRNQGKYAQAEDCHRKALDIRLKRLGEDHPDTAGSYNNLGLVYDNQGKYAQAEECYQKALDIFRRGLGENHRSTASSYDNLGIIYGKQKKYAQAEKFFQKALNSRLKVLGKDHPSTATSYNNLGVVYENQKKYDEAVELYRKAWKIDRQKLGPEHPSTKQDIRNLRRVFPYTYYKGLCRIIYTIFPNTKRIDQDFDTWLSN